MLNVNDLVEGVTKVRILKQPVFVEQPIGSVGVFIKINESTFPPIGVDFGGKQVGRGKEGLYWFWKEDLEIVEDSGVSNKEVVKSNVSSQSEDLIIYKSRWNEIIKSLEGGSNNVVGMTDEELMVVQSVLKTNIPFNVVDDPIVIDK